MLGSGRTISVTLQEQQRGETAIGSASDRENQSILEDIYRDYYTDKQGMGQNDVLSFKIRRKAHGLYEQENRIECDVM